MNNDSISRRDFNRLTMAALGGAVAGSAIGCGGDEQADDATGTGAETETAANGGDAAEEKVSGSACWTETDKHVCRGLNRCKGTGKTGENDCAGMGACANVAAHTCHYENQCYCEGGCGEHPGENACKGKGECAVPLASDTWEKARASFEAAMQAADKEYGQAPAPAEG